MIFFSVYMISNRKNALIFYFEDSLYFTLENYLKNVNMQYQFLTNLNLFYFFPLKQRFSNCILENPPGFPQKLSALTNFKKIPKKNLTKY